MTRLVRSILVATGFVVAATPALAQQKPDNRTPAERAVDAYDPTLRGSRRGESDVRVGDERYGDGRYDDDRRDDRYDDDRSGPGRNGRGHAYGHYKNKEEKEYHKQQDRLGKQGRKGNMCLDANRDGMCDEVQASSRYPSRLPDMMGAVIAARGGRSTEASRWLGDQSYRVRTERSRTGRVSQATWYDPRGALLQRWVDRDLDGRADLVQIYRGGRLVQTVRG